MESIVESLKSLMKNKLAGLILWDKNKNLVNLNDKAKEFSPVNLEIGYCWYNF